MGPKHTSKSVFGKPAFTVPSPAGEGKGEGGWSGEPLYFTVQPRTPSPPAPLPPGEGKLLLPLSPKGEGRHSKHAPTPVTPTAPMAGRPAGRPPPARPGRRETPELIRNCRGVSRCSSISTTSGQYLQCHWDESAGVGNPISLLKYAHKALRFRYSGIWRSSVSSSSLSFSSIVSGV